MDYYYNVSKLKVCSFLVRWELKTMHELRVVVCIACSYLFLAFFCRRVEVLRGGRK